MPLGKHVVFTTFCVLGCVGAVKQVGTVGLYDTTLPRPAGITDPMVASEYAAGRVMGNAVWGYGTMRMLHPKVSTHVAWPDSPKSSDWHRNDVPPSADVLYAAFGPYLLDGSNVPWIFKLAKQLPREGRPGGVASPSRSMPPKVLALGLGVNNARFDRWVAHPDLPSARSCERKANLKEACEMSFKHSVETFELSNSSRSLLDVLEAQSPGYGVRGRLTNAVIARHGYTGAHVLGCPSLFINRHHGLGWRLRRRYDALFDAHHNSNSSVHLRIAYNIHQTKSPHMDRAMLQLVQQNEGSFVIIQESFNLQEIHNRIQNLLGVKFPKEKIRFFYRIEDWFDAVRSVDIQVGSKIHGAMVALAVETPLLLLPPDWRVQEMADAMKLPALPICGWCQLTEWAANPTAKGLVTIAASTFQAEAFDARRQELACGNLDLFHTTGLPLHYEVMPLCHTDMNHTRGLWPG